MLLAVSAFITLSVAAHAQPDLLFIIADKTGYADTLRWGIFPGATNGRDAAYGETEFPPPPPSFLFDARWVGVKEFGEGVKRNYRGPYNALDTFVLKVQPNEDGYPISLSWPGLAGNFQSAQLRFVNTDGAITTADMLERSTIDIVNSDPVSLVTIIVQGSSAPPQIENPQPGIDRRGGDSSPDSTR